MEREALIERLEDRYDVLTHLLREAEGTNSEAAFRCRRREIGNIIHIIETEF